MVRQRASPRLYHGRVRRVNVGDRHVSSTRFCSGPLVNGGGVKLHTLSKFPLYEYKLVYLCSVIIKYL